MSDVVKQAQDRGLYWTGGGWCDWVRELTDRIEQLQAERDEAREIAETFRDDPEVGSELVEMNDFEKWRDKAMDGHLYFTHYDDCQHQSMPMGVACNCLERRAFDGGRAWEEIRKQEQLEQRLKQNLDRMADRLGIPE